MKITLVRFVIAGLIMASLGFSVYYYLNVPDPALSTYNHITSVVYADDYLEFDNEIDSMQSNYPAGANLLGYYEVVDKALTNNFNHYKSYLLFVSDISASDQAAINNKVSEYEQAFSESKRLLDHFNDNANADEQTIEGMYENFVNAYNYQIKLYVEFIDTLKDYIVNYAFDNTTPVGLKQTLLQVQLDFSKVVIQEKIDQPNNPDTLINELNNVINKYENFNNNPQADNLIVINFIQAYNNFDYINDYFSSLNKTTYVNTNAGAQIEYLEVIHTFLSLSSYNL
jgi:hypothetical protein